MSYWLDNAMTPNKHTLVDLGYVRCPISRKRADRLMKYLGKKNFELDAQGHRLMARIPEAKVKSILKKFPRIVSASEKPGYCWCTHSWICDVSNDLSYINGGSR